MKRSLTVLVAVAALAVAALPAGARTTAPAKTQGKNIVALAAATPQLSTLVKLVKSAGLVKALSGTTKLTVFAPTNAAFAKVPAKTLNKLAHDKALLKSVLLYHVAKGELLAKQIETKSSITTLEGAKLKITVKGGSVYVNQAKVITADVKASNGVVHLINGVLIPPSS